ncbi:MAG: porin [Pseudomonadota bacterium]
MIRRSALAIAFALAFPTVHAQSGPAQSGIQLYGIVDAGMERVDNGDANVTRLTSGLSTGSRWGIRGSEDLGGGYRALFTLESRIEVDTGAMNNRGAIFFCPSAPALCPGVVATSPAVPATVVGGMSAVNSSLLQAVSTVNGVNALFDRQAFVGLVTPYGAVLAGRQYTPNYEVLVKYNSFADSFAGNPGQISTINIRANNALQYRAELSGFTLSLMYGFGGSEGNRNERSTVGRGDDFYGANFQYNTPRFGVGVGYNRNNTVTFAAPTENRKGLETYSVGGNATLGNVKLFATYLKAKNENPVLSPVDIQNIVISTGGNLAAINTILGGLYINRFDVDALRGVVGPIDLDVYHLGLNWTIGNGTLMAALNQAKDSARSLWATADAKVDQIGLAYMYNLSRRTQLYGAYAIANNKDQARIALGAACCTGGWTTARAEDSKSLQIGMRHTF